MSIQSSYIPLRKAAKKYKLSIDHLSYLVDSDIIRSIKVGSVDCLLEDDIMDTLPRHERPEYQKFLHLRGTGIGMGEGGRKYGVSQPTISRWVKRGWIDIIGKVGQKVLIDEGDLAYCADIYHSDPSDKQGRWLFTPAGAPRRKATE